MESATTLGRNAVEWAARDAPITGETCDDDAAVAAATKRTIVVRAWRIIVVALVRQTLAFAAGLQLRESLGRVSDRRLEFRVGLLPELDELRQM